MKLTVATAAGSAGPDQDRIAVLTHGQGHILVVADGAGGLSGGGEAAQAVVDFFTRRAGRFQDPEDPATWSIALADLDIALLEDPRGGKATAVVFATGPHLVGASVGDSGAWLIRGGGTLDITERQRRKPRLGTGLAIPVPFGPARFPGRLLVASDGLFQYGSADRLAEIALAGTVAAAAAALVEAVKLPSAGFLDGVAAILCEASVGEEM